MTSASVCSDGCLRCPRTCAAAPRPSPPSGPGGPSSRRPSEDEFRRAEAAGRRPVLHIDEGRDAVRVLEFYLEDVLRGRRRDWLHHAARRHAEDARRVVLRRQAPGSGHGERQTTRSGGMATKGSKEDPSEVRVQPSAPSAPYKVCARASSVVSYVARAWAVVLVRPSRVGGRERGVARWPVGSARSIDFIKYFVTCDFTF